MKYLIVLIYSFFAISAFAQLQSPYGGTDALTRVANASDWGPRIMADNAGSRFHTGYDYPRTATQFAYAVESGSITHLPIATDPDRLENMIINGWRYMHCLFGASSDNLYEIKLHPTANLPILIIRSNATTPIHIYVQNDWTGPNTYTDNSITLNVERTISVGQPIFRPNSWNHLHLDRGWNNWLSTPFMLLPRTDTQSPVNTFSLKYNSNGSAMAFPSNIIYGNILMESEVDYENERDLDNVIMSLGQNNSFSEIFAWRYTGANHMTLTLSDGTSTTPSFNIRQTGVIENIRSSVDEGVYPQTNPGRDAFKHYFNSQETVSGSKIAMGFRYVDGQYTFRSTAYDISGHNTPQDLIRIIDNMRPYIEKVEIYDALIGGNKIYSRSWIWNGTELTFSAAPTSPICNEDKDISIHVFTSEPMTNVVLTAFGASPINNTNYIQGSAGKEWLFQIPAATTTSGLITLTISGKDLANNPIEGFINTNNQTSFPIHQSNSTWIPSALGQNDVVHTFNIESTNKVVVSFSANNTSPNERMGITFTDNSDYSKGLAPYTYLWDFGANAIPQTANSKGPHSVSYNESGLKTVSLNITDAAGNTFKKVLTDYINVSNVPLPPVADFTMSATQINEGQSVTFTDVSTNNPTSWRWTFSGGSPSSGSSKSHVVVYNTAGNYSVTLISMNNDGNSSQVSKTIKVVKPQVTVSGKIINENWIALSGVVVSYAPGGSTTTNSNGIYSFSVNYNWTGTIQPILKGYSFTPVALDNVQSNSVVNFTGFAQSLDFTYLPVDPAAGDYIEFVAKDPFLAGKIIWDFGDGSTPENPASYKAYHTYQTSGNFNVSVCLTTDPSNKTTKLLRISSATSFSCKTKFDIVGCSIVPIGVPINIIDRTTDYPDMSFLQINWGDVTKKYYTLKCTELYGNCVGEPYPTDRRFSHSYSTKGKKNIVALEAYRDYCNTSFTKSIFVVDCNSAVSETDYSKAVYDNSSGEEKYWAGYFNLSNLNKIADFNNKSITLTACNSIILKAGFTSKPSVGKSLTITFDACLTSNNLKSTNDQTNQSYNYQTESLENSFSIYPNPTQGIFILEFKGDISQIRSYKVFNSNGNLIVVNFVTNSINTVDLKEYPAGVYLIQINYLNKIEYGKVIVE